MQIKQKKCNSSRIGNAQQYGKTLSLFHKNKAEIDFGQLDYTYVKLRETMKNSGLDEAAALTVHNRYGLKIRPEKQIAEVIGLSRSQVQKQIAQKKIQMQETDFGKCLKIFLQ